MFNQPLVKIFGKRYALCEFAAQRMWSHNKNDKNEIQKYNRGLLNSNNDPYLTERTGRLGEMAVCLFLNNDKMDVTYRPFGDRGDLIISKRVLEVKTARHNYGELLVRHISSGGKIVPIKSDLFIAATVEFENKVKKYAMIKLVGWIDFENFIKKAKLKPAKRGKHINFGYSP